jgi:hypothetical protein
VVLAFASIVNGCQQNMSSSPPPKRDINAVLADNDKRLMNIDGVVGVYVGLLNDDRTPCLHVMLARDTPQIREALPKSIEGYAVVAEVSGEIRPLARP